MFRSVTTKLYPQSAISTNISQRLGTPQDIDSFASGVSNNYIPKTYSSYQQYRKYMHEILCLGLLEARLYLSEKLKLYKLNITCNDRKLIEQEPDLYSIDGDVLRVCEVSLTFNFESRMSDKNSKYQDLWKYIEDNSNYIVQYSPLVVDLSDSEWVDSVSMISKPHLQLLKRFVDNLVLIHSSDKGESYRQQSSLDLNIGFPFEWDEDQHFDELSTHLGIKDPSPLYSLNKSLMKGYGRIDLKGSDTIKYLDDLCNAILTSEPKGRPFPHPAPLIPKEFNDDWAAFISKPSTTSKIPVVLQLGAPTLTDEIDTPSKIELYKKIRENKFSGGYLDLIKSSTTSLGEFEETGILKLNLSEEMLNIEMSQGPGRKKYNKLNNIDNERSPPVHMSPSQEHLTLINELISLITELDGCNYLKSYVVPDLETVGNGLNMLLTSIFEELSGNGFNYLLRFYSRITTEIILNSMKRRKSRQYVLGSSGFEGVYFLIAPGPQLRTESNVEFIKIISFVEPITHKLSRSWKETADHWESEWLSVDTDRLKHWSRCQHRVNLSIIASAEKLCTTTKKLNTSIKEELQNGNYGLMSLIYLEDKSNTSTCIQTTRYVFMKSLGDKQLSGLMSKFPTRVSSVLQSFVMQQMVKFANRVCKTDTNQLIRSTQIKRDENLGTLDETTTGVVGLVPRVFTFGSSVPIQYLFNEIYWCMMYNKDRQNKVQDSMKILSKIAKEELKLMDELSRRESDRDKLLHFYGVHSVSDDINHIKTDNPESHYYSHTAVSISAALQDVHPENVAPRTTWFNSQKLHDILNKNLSEYATFKASVADIKRHVDLNSYDDIKEIGSRTKCIELIYEIVHNEKLHKACEIAMSFSGVNSNKFKTVIQIFKKNQIGGVREILILYIKARVVINLTEEICRLLSKSDKREILTKGKDKRLMMRGDFEELSSQFPEGTPLLFIKNSYDMSTWCQKFIPTIFLPNLNHHGTRVVEIRKFCQFVMLKHCTKEIEFPQKLVQQWCKYPSLKHSEEHLQHYKEKFLRDGQPFMTNVSNMGQGILHYNSTVLALQCQSLRDKLFELCLKKLGKPMSIRYKTRVGSDDKGDTIACDMTSDDYLYQARLFEQCAAASERLHAMELSVKSASGNIIYELNSAYMSNLEVQSPIIKFTLAACDMIGTDSCTSFVNESYSRIRQLRENGGSSVCCIVAHLYNKEHFDDIFATGEGDVNDPVSIFNIKRKCVPYDFGVYPIYDADIQDMIGPEYYNYKVFTDRETPEPILRMLYSPHKMEDQETYIPDDNDETLFKKSANNITMGLVRQLVNMRERLGLSREEVDEYLSENPFLIIRGPSDVRETEISIAAKLYTRGAAVSLRRTSPVIYLGRLTAFRKSNAWDVFMKDPDETEGRIRRIRVTYKDYLTKLYELYKNTPMSTSMLELKTLIFPQHNSFEVVRTYASQFGMRRLNHKVFSQSIRTWVLNNYNYNFYHSLKSIMETAFGLSTAASKSDVDEMKKAMPFDISSYEGFIEDCRTRSYRPLDVFYYLSKFYKMSNLKRAQVFAYGPTTSSLNMTLANIKKYNHMIGHTMEVDFELDLDRREQASTFSRDNEYMKLAFNLLMLHEQGCLSTEDGEKILDPLSEVQTGEGTLKEFVETTIRNTRNVNGMESQSRKIYMMLASSVLTKSEFKDMLLAWKQLSYSYIRKQKKDSNGDWYGDFELLVNFSNECYTINVRSGRHEIITNKIENIDEFYQSLLRICRVMKLSMESFFTVKMIHNGSIYKSGNKLFRSRGNATNKLELNLLIDINFGFVRLRDLSSFIVEIQRNRDFSTTLKLCEGDKSLTLNHYPGHYYPVEVPRKFRFNENVFVNGLRITKLFKQRQWFVNGQLFPFNNSESIDILKNHVIPSELNTGVMEFSTKIQEFVEDYEERLQETLMEFEDIKPPEINDHDLKVDLKNQYKALNSGTTIMELFSNAAKTMDISSWIRKEAEDTDFSGYNDTEMTSFARALGENKIRRDRKEFFTITNLKLNLSFTNRILDLFFKGNSIKCEEKMLLPDYAIHIQSCINKSRGDKKLLVPLKNYIISRLAVVTGKSEMTIITMIDELVQTRSDFSTLNKLNRYLSNNTASLYDMLAETTHEEQEQESEEDDW